MAAHGKVNPRHEEHNGQQREAEAVRGVHRSTEQGVALYTTAIGFHFIW
jgi:hypothetical protein